MERIFALYDSDVFYATRFMEYFKKKKDSGFEITVFTCQESLKEFLKEHSIDILLLGNPISPEYSNNDRVKYIYHLSEKTEDVSETGYPSILKYQAVQSVMTQIVTDYHRRENESQVMIYSRNVKIISVFSPTQNLETLLFALSAGSLLSAQKKVLLVLLELLPIRLANLIDCANQSLTEFIYHLKENQDVITKMKQQLGYQGNLNYLTGIANGADILALSKEDIQKWITELRLHSDYQTVVFCVGCYSEAMVELLQLSDTVFTMDKDSGYEKLVFEEFTRQMERTGISINQSKFIKILTPKESDGQTIPVSILELTHTPYWVMATQHLNRF